jgi:sugar transferase (PEP-CTERM/EpsH1 system associated)
MREVCARLVTVPRHEPRRNSPRFYAGVAARLLDPLPYAVAKYRSRAYRRTFDALVERGGFDRVVCDFLVPAVNIGRAPTCPTVLFTHNVEAEIWRRHAETSTHPVARRLYAGQWRRMLRFEGRTLARFDHVLAVSDADADTFGRLYGRQLAAPVSVVPTGVDTAYFSPAPETAMRPHHLVFVGSMDWMPNEDAVIDFCRAILPLIRREIPDVTLSIVGRAPAAAVRQLTRDPGIAVTGRVDDVRPFLREAAAAIVPLRVGGGTRLKIFEAMAAGKAVVSTTIGAEGLPTEDGRHLLIADGPESFARATVGLLRNPDQRRTIEQAARSLVVGRHDWAVAATHLERSLAAVASLAQPTPSMTGKPAAARSLS